MTQKTPTRFYVHYRENTRAQWRISDAFTSPAARDAMASILRASGFRLTRYSAA